MQLAAVNALYADLHDEEPYHDGTFESWSAKRTSQYPFRYDEGVTIWVANEDFDPTGTWLERPKPDDEQGEAVSD